MLLRMPFSFNPAIFPLPWKTTSTDSSSSLNNLPRTTPRYTDLKPLFHCLTLCLKRKASNKGVSWHIYIYAHHINSYHLSFRNMMNNTASLLLEPLKNGCWSANAVLSFSHTLTHSKKLIGRVQLVHTPTWRKCHPSFHNNGSLLHSTPSQPLPTRSSYKGSSFLPTLLCVNIWSLRLHHHSE